MRTCIHSVLKGSLAAAAFGAAIITGFPVAAAADEFGGLSPGGGRTSVNRTIQDELVRRKNLVISGQKALNDGAQLYAADELEAARERFRWVLDNVPVTQETMRMHQAAAAGVINCDIHLGNRALEKKDWEAARTYTLNGLELSPENRELKRILLEAEKELGLTTEHLPVWEKNSVVTPEFVKAVEEVRELLYEGDQFRNTGQYLVADRRYQQALAIDPYNEQARAGIERTAELKHKYYKDAQIHGRNELLYQVTKGWERPVPKNILKPESEMSQLPASLSNIGRMNEKLASMIVDRVAFEQATIEEAVEFLRKKARELDPEGLGVNFVLKTAVFAAPAADGAAAAPAPAAARQIDLKLDQLNMLEVVKLVAQQADMKWRVDEFAVVFAPNAENLETLFTQEFRVPPGFITSKIDLGGGEQGKLGEAVTIQREEIRKKLEGFGVEFPTGATAVYLPNGSRLVVRNTQQNLDLIEEALRQEGGDVAPQVQIETRFLEINQSDIDELSFRWNINQRRRGQSTVTDTPGLRTSVPADLGEGWLPTDLLVGNGALSANSLDSLLSQAIGLFTDPIGNSLQHALTLGKYKFEMLVYALSQKTGNDLMAAPKVTTKSGQEAEIKIVQQFYYPEEYEDPEIDDNISILPSGNFVRFVTPSSPTTFEQEEVGVILTVNPQVGPDNLTVDLTLVPKVVEFEGFINYGTPINSIDLTTGETLPITDNIINKPVFNLRQVETKVQVSDGQTVMLGGLIREDVQKIDDKIPLFGDIPLVGRLFRSKIDQSVKKNLLIFVTCNLVRPDGGLYNRRPIEDPNSFDNWPEFETVTRMKPVLAPAPRAGDGKDMAALEGGK